MTMTAVLFAQAARRTVLTATRRTIVQNGPVSNVVRRLTARSATQDHHHDEHGTHGDNEHGFERSPRPTAAPAAAAAAAVAVVAAVVCSAVAARAERVPTEVGAAAAPMESTLRSTPTTTLATPSTASVRSAPSSTSTEAPQTPRAAAQVTEELMDATRCLPGYLSERLSEFTIGMLKDDVVGVAAEMKNGRRVYASVVGTISNKLRTVGLWPETAARNGFDRGVVVYLDDNHVAGVLLWGVSHQVDRARALLLRPDAVHDPKELYGVFDL